MPPGGIIDRKQRQGEIRSDTHAKRKCHWDQGTQVLSEEKSQGPVEEGRKRKSKRWNIIGDEWLSVLNDVLWSSCLTRQNAVTQENGLVSSWCNSFPLVGRAFTVKKKSRSDRQVRRGYSKHTMFHWQAGKQKVDICRHCSSTSTHNGGQENMR